MDEEIDVDWSRRGEIQRFSKEIRIVWLQDPLNFKYLREHITIQDKNKGFDKRWINVHHYLLIGYAEVEKEKGEVYRRRFWYLKPYDWDLDPNSNYNPSSPNFHGFPAEAVIPSSIKLNENSKKIKMKV